MLSQASVILSTGGRYPWYQFPSEGGVGYLGGRVSKWWGNQGVGYPRRLGIQGVWYWGAGGRWL